MKRIDVFYHKSWGDVGELPPETAAEFQSWINKTLDSIPREFFGSARVEIYTENYYEGYYPAVEIFYFRPETAEEIAEEEAEKQAKLNRAQRDRLDTFLRLKEEFEGKGDSK